MCLRPWLRPGCTLSVLPRLHRLVLLEPGSHCGILSRGYSGLLSGTQVTRDLGLRDGDGGCGDGGIRVTGWDGVERGLQRRWVSGRAGGKGGGGGGGEATSGAAGLISMANVTRRNFAESLEQLKGQLSGADFVAVDLEMTGVESTKWRRNLELDSYETRYQNLKHSAEKFAVWQCGVCPFKWNAEQKKWVAYPYNFFVFPRNELQLELPSRGFFAQTTSLEFLTKHRFDFNACIYDGISYLSHEQEAAARGLLGLVDGKGVFPSGVHSHGGDVPLTRSGDAAFVEKIRSQIAKWRDELLYNRQKWQVTNENLVFPSVPVQSFSNSPRIPLPADAAPDATPDHAVTIKRDIDVGPSLGSLRPSLTLDVTSHYQARLVKQVIKTHFPDLIAVVNAKGGNAPPERSRIRVIFVSPKEDMAKVLQELADEERGVLEARISHAVGFRKVLDAIVASGLPVVGHNCILDMTHIHSKFLGSLPATAADFSSSLQGHFPCIVDTKYLLRAEPTLRGILASRSTSLAVVFTHICQGFADKAVASGRFYFGKGKILNNAFTKVAVEVAEEFQRYGGAKDTGLKHEAGFDAYMTGSVFAQACHLLQVDAATIQRLPEAVKLGEQGFASYANLLALGWVGNMVLDLTTGKEATGVKALRGPTPPADRHLEHSTVALVWGFPSGSNEAEVRLIVQRVFNAERKFPPADITIVDESSAFVHFKDPRHMHQFLRLMQGPRTVSEPAVNSVPASFRAAPYQAYEHLCRSPLTSERLAESADILQLERIYPQPSPVDSIVHDILHGNVRKDTEGTVSLDEPHEVEDAKEETEGDSRIGVL
ncbi:hypothetical protein M758_5G096300 [Ceratodon purpureus]|nr:hypothetical protein M758_5G096300 [Ceratodon purpureus]